MPTSTYPTTPPKNVLFSSSPRSSVASDAVTPILITFSSKLFSPNIRLFLLLNLLITPSLPITYLRNANFPIYLHFSIYFVSLSLRKPKILLLKKSWNSIVRSKNSPMFIFPLLHPPFMNTPPVAILGKSSSKPKNVTRSLTSFSHLTSIPKFASPSTRQASSNSPNLTCSTK